MKKIIAGMLAVMVLIVAGAASAGQVPPLINFQSVLYDDAGEPIPDGSSAVNFRITDINGSVLYEENQTLDVVRGMVSAMVGNGLTSNGSPAGGIPSDIFEADAGRYLEVTVDDYQPQATMEIVSVPYSLYADKALGAVDGSIGGEAIKDGAIAARHFSDEALKELGGAMVSSNSFGAPSAAQSIGVRSGFSYSGSSNIQGVLTDLDRVMATRNAQMDSTVTNLQSQIANETSFREDGDSNLQTQINNHNSRITNVENRATTVETNISALNNYFNGAKIYAWGYGWFTTSSSNDPKFYVSEGVSSIDKMGYITFTTPLPDSNYMVIVNGHLTYTNSSGSIPTGARVSTRSASSFKILADSNTDFDFLVIVPNG